MPCDKRSFSLREANEALTLTQQAARNGVTKRQESRVYFCTECGAYHLTSQQSAKRPRTKPYKRSKYKRKL